MLGNQDFLPKDACDFFELSNKRVAVAIVLRQYKAQMGLSKFFERAYQDMNV
jgi:hypothetical protein